MKCPYFSPKDCDPRGQNEKLTAKRIFDFLIIENCKLIIFGRVFFRNSVVKSALDFIFIKVQRLNYRAVEVTDRSYIRLSRN